MLYQEIDQELLPPPPKKTKSLGEELLPPPPKKKENLGLNELPTPSGNGLSSTPKVEEVVPVGQLPQVKKTLEDFGIKAPVIPKEQQVNQPVSTEVVQPKITASYNDFVAHNEERKVKHSKLVDEAIENSAKKVLKNKGVIKPEEEGKALNISQFAQLSTEKQRLQEALDNGDATFAIGKDGELGLKKTIGFWDALTKGWNQATKANDEAAEFANTDAAGKLAILKKQQEEAPPSEYLGERPSGVGSIGQLAGENAPFLGKAIAASAAGSALVLAAPETAGASLAGLPAAMAFAFTANDSKNQGIQSEVTRRFYQLKQENPEADEVELMKQAEEGTLMGGMAGILTNAALMSSVKTPLSNVAKGVVGKSITKAVGNAVYGGAATAAIEGAKLAEGNLEGIKATPTEIAKEMGHTFSETATTLGLLHVMTGAVTGALKLPNIVKSAFKYALKDAKPTEIQSTLKANVDAGTITPEAAEKVTTDLEQYKAAVAKTPNGLSPEAEASVAGLIQAKDKLIAEMKTKDDTAKPFYEEKIEGINGQIQKTVNTGKPYAHEIDEISGEKYTEQKEQPQPEVIEPSTEIKSEVLKDVESTTKALEELAKTNPDLKINFGLSEAPLVLPNGETNAEGIAKDYHKAKADGSNPELVKAVEEALTPKTEPSTVKSEEVNDRHDTPINIDNIGEGFVLHRGGKEGTLSGFNSLDKVQAEGYSGKEGSVTSSTIKKDAKVLKLVTGDTENYKDNEVGINEFYKIIGEKEKEKESEWADGNMPSDITTRLLNNPEAVAKLKKAGIDVVIGETIDGPNAFIVNENAVEKVTPKSENKPIQPNEEVIKNLEQERDTKIKELEKVEVPKLEYVKEDDLVKMKNETELIEEQRGIKKREGQLKQLIKCLTGL